MRWRIDLEYDGSPFAGFQLQPGRATVQSAVEEALERLFGHPIRVSPAGRTDTGVHARQMVCAFVSDVERSERSVRDGLNALLPEAIACLSATPVPDAFDPRHTPHTKTYRYTWLVRPARSPLRRGRVWHVRGPLDVDTMHAAARALVGQHDFSSFRAQGCTSTHPIRTLVDAAVAAAPDDEVVLRVRGTGFLRHMVRIVAGTLYEIGRGERPAGWMEEVLSARDRRAAGRTAPAEGLLLEDITYEGER